MIPEEQERLLALIAKAENEFAQLTRRRNYLITQFVSFAKTPTAKSKEEIKEIDAIIIECNKINDGIIALELHGTINELKREANLLPNQLIIRTLDQHYDDLMEQRRENQKGPRLITSRSARKLFD